MPRRRLARLRARRSASTLELLIASIALLLFLAAMYTAGSLFWTHTVMTTSGDVAAMSAQSAYDRWRFGPDAFFGDQAADNANHAIAEAKAHEAAEVVLSSMAEQSTGGAGGLLGIGPDPSCGTGTPPYVAESVRVTQRATVANPITRFQVSLAARFDNGLSERLGALSVCLRSESYASAYRGEMSN